MFLHRLPRSQRTRRSQVRASGLRPPLGAPCSCSRARTASSRTADVLGYDEHRADVMALKRPPWLPPEIRRTAYPLPLDDTDINWCTQWLQDEYRVSWKEEAVHVALNGVAHLSEYHPIRAWLSGLVWDGVSRGDDWLTDYVGASNTVLVRAFGARWLISAVARVLAPGCKVDTILVLEGEQGLGKSQALRAIITGSSTQGVSAHGSWFTDEKIDLEAKDGKMLLGGVWIAEFSELGQLAKAEVETIKAFISRSVDRFRYPWARRPVERPRQCVYGASTNSRNYLKDPTGNRRFWPVRCANEDANIAGLISVRDQLWAEAVVRYKAGEKWWLHEPHLKQAHAEAVDARREIDPWEPLVEEWADRRLQATTLQVLTMLEIDKARRSKADEQRAAAILFRLGFTERRRVRRGAIREWVYFRDEALLPSST